jgi:putative FmdB family regulatory protein
MRYDYKCEVCGFIEEQIHKMTETPEFKCPECGGAMSKIFTVTNFIIRGGTEAMDWKEKRIRMQRRKELGVKQIERYGSGPKLQPNVGGIETDSWSDAAKLAKEAGMSEESYQGHIAQERDISKVSNISDNAWKKAKAELN